MPHSRTQLKQFARNMRNTPTDAEYALWQHLRTRRLDGHRFVRQYVIDSAIVDFACPNAKLAIELDGGQHDQLRAHDELRTERLNRAGYKVIRFWNNEIATNIESALYTIREALRTRSCKPLSQGERGASAGERGMHGRLEGEPPPETRTSG